MQNHLKATRYLNVICSLLTLTFLTACSQVNQSPLFSDAKAVTKKSTHKPNIIFILVDDMGIGEPSFAGGIIPTPAIDSLAEQGIQFSDAHTSSSVCTPTRYSILTGRYNWRSRLKSAALVKATSPALMDPKRLSLPKLMQQSGYDTNLVGKWHLGVDWQLADKNNNPDRDKPANEKSKWSNPKTETSWLIDYSQPFKNGPIDHGFDDAFFILSSLDMPPYVYLKDNKATAIPTVNKGFPHNEYNDYQRVGAAAADFDANTVLEKWATESRHVIKTKAAQQIKTDKPFFLYLSLTSPHTPVTPGDKFKGRYPQYSMYADFMAETDWVVEQVLAQVKASGIEDNTMIVFTSDNGFAPYVEIPKMIEAGYKPSGEFRGAKANIYEGGHRVPLLVKWPAKINPGLVSDKKVSTTDFYATFADILGTKNTIPDKAAEDSFSFYNNLSGIDEQIRPYIIHHSIKGKFAIAKDGWKLILTDGDGGGWKLPWSNIETQAKFVQLYNLKTDPAETINLELKHPEIVNELVNLLAKAMQDGRTTPGSIQTNEGWPYRDQPTLKQFPQLRNTQEM